MADFSGLSLAGGAYDPRTSLGGLTSPTSSPYLTGTKNVSSFSPNSSNYYSSPNPAFSSPASALTAPVLKTATPPTSPLTKQPIQSFGSTNHTVTTPVPAVDQSGAIVSTYGDTKTGPSSFSIDTSGTVPSAALGTNYSLGDVKNTRNQYADYVNQLSQAQQYSPDYLASYQRSKELAASEAALRGNLATGNVPGDTQGFAEGFTNRALMGADAQKAFADISLAAEELRRQGNIAGAKALVDAYAPTSVSPGSSLVSPVTGEEQYSGLGGYTGVQAIQTYNNFQQNFADAQIPPYDQSKTPEQNLQIAQSLVAKAPSFQSRSTIPVTLPGGGYALVNKNQVAGYRPDGTAIIVSPAQAAQADAAKNTLNDLTKQRAQVQSAITTADSNFPLLLDAAKRAGLNNSSPLVNQLQQAVARRLVSSDSIAVLNTMLPSLQTEYSRIISRGGGSTVDERATSKALIDGTYSLNQLQAVYNTVKKEGANVIKGFDEQINQQNAALNGIYNTSTPPPNASTQPSGSEVYSF